MADHGSNWAWIDIACIDQENVPVKMDEVGRQASIFKQAAKSYVWLSHLSQNTLRDSYGALAEAGVEVDAWIGNPSSKMILPTLQRLHKSVTTILEDPWFSSLWTLQEIMMRNDTLIITMEGQEAIAVLEGIEPHRLFMDILMNTLINVMKSMQYVRPIIEQNNLGDCSAELHVAASIHDRIYRSGLFAAHMASNPNLQYGMAKYRQTKYPEDRVYGIMQIYNLRVGQAVRPHDSPTLEELTVEFGKAINLQSALWGQIFVHTASTRPGLSWCITEDSAVPTLLGLGGDARHTRAVTKINAVEEGQSCPVRAVGYLCKFQAFYEVNLAAAPLVHMELFFDYSICHQNPDLDSGLFRYSGSSRDHNLWQRQGRDFISHLASESLFLWLLGDRESGPLRPPFRQHYAVLIREIRTETGCRTKAYERLGVCTWSMVREKEDLLGDDGGRHDYKELESRFVAFGIRAPEKMAALSTHTSNITSLFWGPMTIDLI